MALPSKFFFAPPPLPVRKLPQNEDDLKNEDDLQNEDNLKNEDDLKNGDNLKNEDKLKNYDNLKIKTATKIDGIDPISVVRSPMGSIP